jgi:hypothetical protein
LLLTIVLSDWANRDVNVSQVLDEVKGPVTKKEYELLQVDQGT